MSAASKVIRLLPAVALVVAALAAFGTLAVNVLGNGRLSFDESGNLVRALWYASGAVKPFTAGDPAAPMPLYAYLLGFWQAAVGTDIFTARVLSVVFTVLDAALLFAISRRLTANTQVAAAAVFIFLVTPAAAYFHVLALPVAVTTFFHLLAIFCVVLGLGRPRVGVTIAFAIVLAVAVLLDRNMLAAVLFLGPLYVFAVGKQRAIHAALALGIFALVLGGAFAILGPRWLEALLAGPVLAPMLKAAGLSPTLALLDANTNQGAAVALSMPPGFGGVVLDSLILPFGAAIVCALVLFAIAGQGLRVLWAVPLYMLWLIGARLLAPLATCEDCVIRGVGSDMAIIALGCALTLALAWRSARQQGLTASVVVLGGTLLITALNTFGPVLATRPDRQYFPAPMLRYPGSGTERAEMRALEEFIAKNAPARQPILILHAVPEVPLAATFAGRRIPPQSLNPMSAFRTIRGPSGRREATLAAVEGAGLWADETLMRWLERDYDAVLIEADLRGLDRAKIDTALAAGFERAGEITIAGRPFTLYRRKA